MTFGSGANGALGHGDTKDAKEVGVCSCDVCVIYVMLYCIAKTGEGNAGV